MNIRTQLQNLVEKIIITTVNTKHTREQGEAALEELFDHAVELKRELNRPLKNGDVLDENGYAVLNRRQLMQALAAMDSNLRVSEMQMSDCVILEGAIVRDSDGKKTQLSVSRFRRP